METIAGRRLLCRTGQLLLPLILLRAANSSERTSRRNADCSFPGTQAQECDVIQGPWRRMRHDPGSQMFDKKILGCFAIADIVMNLIEQRWGGLIYLT